MTAATRLQSASPTDQIVNSGHREIEVIGTAGRFGRPITAMAPMVGVP
jgi:hypothetical protein